jgi:hypothetical protein
VVEKITDSSRSGRKIGVWRFLFSENSRLKIATPEDGKVTSGRHIISPSFQAGVKQSKMNKRRPVILIEKMNSISAQPRRNYVEQKIPL